ncbi:FAD-binding protein [Sphingobium sp. CAP-1]|uniref:FAD-binding protein n=1 Tax=Sphingobium sp. CAP-1 TaxID=2676077 RepID=UPI0012BB2FAD|nr:FAD-binding protein [Sphingobium sp. CAP-1]QGP79427.1 FAD-binding protein [Sphingobium sp. CAP-1]
MTEDASSRPEPRPGDAHWFSDVEAPLRVESAEAVAWDRSADLVVVGYGGAGVAAALQAREDGLSVIAIDRFAGGGATRINGGIFYGGGGTPAQKEAGVEDTPEDMFRYLQMETQGVVGDDTLRRFCETSVDNAEWLARHGVRFEGRLYAKKTSYPHTDYSLYHSDNSLAPRYKAVAKPAARGHRALVDKLDAPMGYGKGLYDPLRASADRAGVECLSSATVRRLVIDVTGRVVGVSMTEMPVDGADAKRYAKLVKAATALVLRLPPAMPGSGLLGKIAAGKFAKAREIEQRIGVTRLVQAKRGVCLSAGGFIFNREMVRHYAPKYLMGMPLGTPGDNGSGIRLGQSVGGTVTRLHHISAWRFINPPIAWAQGMVVNGRGKRYVNEMLYGASIGMPMVEENEGACWIILDDEQRRKAMAQAKDKGALPFQAYPAMMAMWLGAKKASTLDGLAKKCGFDQAAFSKSVEDYNQLAATRMPDPFGKGPDDIAPVRKGPFHAINMSIDAKLGFLPVLSLGGLKVDEDSGAVLDGAGAPIAGLYAAGRNAVGVCSNIYVSGLSVADCVFSGRRAARSTAAAQV